MHQGTETLYDDANRVKKQSWSLFQTEDGKTTTKTYTGRYTYNTGNGTMSTADFGTGRTATFAYDNLQRLTGETMAGLYTKNYTYRDISSTRTTTQIASESYTGLCSGWLNRGASYTYDAMGNIATITGPYKNKKSVQRTYTYDAQNQLLSEKIGSDTTSYTYDTAGNIRSISGPSVSKSFSYNDSGDWKDLLTSVTVNGTTRSITYEEENGVTIGNPLSYFNGTQYTLAWQNGRQLASLSGGGKSATYTYGADGIRTRKTVTDSNGTTTYQYTTQNGQIARQSWSAGGTAYQMDFIYDAAGRPLAMYYRTKAAGQTDFNGDSYYYETNQQGDVTGLYKITYNATTKALSATRVASYEYDTWGNVTYSTGTMAKINPLKYRGYYHDAESGFYYLQSRYYDPAIGRFVNADDRLSLQTGFFDMNQFAYCCNNPVNMQDQTGHWSKWNKRLRSALLNMAKKFLKSISLRKFSGRHVYRLSNKSNRRPYQGEPGSTYRAPNGDTRTYGPDGKPSRDYDHDDHGYPKTHPHDENGGHSHDWENGVRGPAYSTVLESIAGVALVAACVIGIAAVAADDVTLIGIADDFLFYPLGTGIEKGLVMIFGS